MDPHSLGEGREGLLDQSSGIGNTYGCSISGESIELGLGWQYFRVNSIHCGFSSCYTITNTSIRKYFPHHYLSFCENTKVSMQFRCIPSLKRITDVTSTHSAQGYKCSEGLQQVGNMYVISTVSIGGLWYYILYYR